MSTPEFPSFSSDELLAADPNNDIYDKLDKLEKDIAELQDFSKSQLESVLILAKNANNLSKTVVIILKELKLQKGN